MGEEFKRLLVITSVLLLGGTGFLLFPLLKFAARPASVPSTALRAAGLSQNYWIDCPNVAAPTRYHCTIYSKDGASMILQGTFQESGGIASRGVAYYGSAIYWRHGLVLRPLHLDCVAGGRPPDVPGCPSAAR